MNKAIILTTKDDEADYWVGKFITWKKIPFNIKKIEKGSRVFIYFTSMVEHGKKKIRRKEGNGIKYYGVLLNKNPLEIELTYKCLPINISQLRDYVIISERSCLRGNILYLNENKFNKLSELMNQQEEL